MANIVDPDHNAPRSSLIWVCDVCSCVHVWCFGSLHWNMQWETEIYWVIGINCRLVVSMENHMVNLIHQSFGQYTVVHSASPLLLSQPHLSLQTRIASVPINFRMRKSKQNKYQKKMFLRYHIEYFVSFCLKRTDTRILQNIMPHLPVSSRIVGTRLFQAISSSFFHNNKIFYCYKGKYEFSIQ